MTRTLPCIRHLLCRSLALLFAAALGCSPEAGPDAGLPLGTRSEGLAEATAGLTVNLEDLGARCDNSTGPEDLKAFVAAFSKLSTAGGGTLLIPAGDCHVAMTSYRTWLTIPSNVTIRGVPGASRIFLDTDLEAPGQGRALFGVSRENITLEDLELYAATGRDSNIIHLTPVTNFTMRRVVLDGRLTTSGRAAHGIRLTHNAARTPHQNLRWEQCTFRNLDFGLLQTEYDYTNISGVVFTGSTFEGNFGDDLEFNAPEAVMKNVEVSNSTFRNNRRSTDGGGFGIGLANVQGVVIRGNTFTNYTYEPVHIEDDSADILVEGNTFTRGYLRSDAGIDWRSHIFIISGSHDLTIRGNYFDMSANTLPIQAVYASPGGRDETMPTTLLLEHNTFVLGSQGTRFMVSGMPGFTESDNRVYVSDKAWTSAVNGTGMGPVERDRSNGDRGAADGHTLTLAGVPYAKGVGVHATSKIVMPLGKKYSHFKAHIGVDDEMGNAGSVVFSVVVDGVELYNSGTMRGSSPTKAVEVDLTGKSELQLLVGDAGDGMTCDHADWADARLD